MLNDTTTWSHAPDNQVVPSRWQMTVRVSGTGFLTTYYDGAGSLGAATPIPLMGGQTTTTDFALAATAG